MTLLLALAASAQTLPAPAIKVGDPALLFSLPAVNEEVAVAVVARSQVALSDFVGVAPVVSTKLVVVHFCALQSCASQLSALDQLQRRYGSKGLKTVAIVESADVASLSSMVEPLKLSFPVLQDAYGIVVDRYGVQTLPMTFLIDGGGDIDAIGVVTGNDLSAQVEALVTPQLD